VTHDRSLDLITKTPEMRDVWVRALTLLLMRKNEDKTPGDQFERYLRMQWNRADTDRSGSLTLPEVKALLRKMNIMAKKQWVSEKMKEFDDDHNGTMDFEEFQRFMRALGEQRYDVKSIIRDIQKEAGASRQTESNLTAQQLCHFMNTVQRSRTESLWTVEGALKVIREATHESATSLTPMQFASLLDDKANSAFDPISMKEGCGDNISRYMSLPLSHYWINSSHNTYLTGDQLQGNSTSDQYTFVLQRGCRCVELDCWDGAVGVPEGNRGDDPIITHGHTLCTKILFRDVIKAINAAAFTHNPYPVILSIEMHCSQRFQEKMYEICEEIFGEQLQYLPENWERDFLLSPEELKNKILVKGKRAKPASVAGGKLEDLEDSDSSDEDEAEPDDPELKSKSKEAKAAQAAAKKKLKDKGKGAKDEKEHKSKISANWSKLIYLVATHFKGFDHPGKPYEMSSFAEGKTKKLCEQSREAFIEYNQRQLSRVYPFGGRVDSSNLDPILAWAAGCQLVALNFQTGDCPMWLNFGKFLENGSTGYILKPAYMRGTGPKLLPCHLSVCVLSCQRLPNNHASSDIVDVYVQVELHGVYGDSQVKRTGVVPDNGFNPSFNGGKGEEFSFEIQEREVAILKFLVMDEDFGQDDMIGQCCIPVTCIRPGIRHVPLYDTYNGPVNYAGILCKFSIDYI